MKIKVCGMRNQSNIEELVKLKPDYIGFIFYPKSKRFIGEKIPDEIQSLIPVYIQKVGVFVDEPFNNLLEKFKSNKLDMIQLLSLIHISEPTRLGMISYAVFCLK